MTSQQLFVSHHPPMTLRAMTCSSLRRTPSTGTRLSTSSKKPVTINCSAWYWLSDARHQVEQILRLDLAHSCAMRTAHVVGFDLQAGNAIGPRPLIQHQVIVLLVSVGFLGEGAL